MKLCRHDNKLEDGKCPICMTHEKPSPLDAVTCRQCGTMTINNSTRVMPCEHHLQSGRLFSEVVNMLKTVHREGAGMHYEAIAELLSRCKKAAIAHASQTGGK